MEDQLIIMYCVVTSVLSSLFMAFFMRWVSDRAMNHRIRLCETQIESLISSIRGQSGNIVKAEKAERMNMAMAEAAAMLQDPKADKGQVMQTLIAKYPDVAMSLAKKYAGL